jgi:hypothetical protein
MLSCRRGKQGDERRPAAGRPQPGTGAHETIPVTHAAPRQWPRPLQPTPRSHAASPRTFMVPLHACTSLQRSERSEAGGGGRYTRVVHGKFSFEALALFGPPLLP